MQKKEWLKPELVVLMRNKPEEISSQLVCKIDNGGPRNYCNTGLPGTCSRSLNPNQNYSQKPVYAEITRVAE